MRKRRSGPRTCKARTTSSGYVDPYENLPSFEETLKGHPRLVAAAELKEYLVRNLEESPPSRSLRDGLEPARVLTEKLIEEVERLAQLGDHELRWRKEGEYWCQRIGRLPVPGR